MIAEKNENIKTAYEILEKASKSKNARMAYEARQAEIMDQLTREKFAKEEAREEEKIKIAKNLLGLLEDEVIAEKTGLSIEVIRELKK